MRNIPTYGIEAKRWTIVFHRQAENRFFSAIAMGHFKHVSAFAWLPELSQWWIYDVGFRRTRLKVVVESEEAHRIIVGLARGNALVTMEVRDDDLPWFRLGMFCTTGVAHLIGVRTRALRPDALFRQLLRQGGVLRDDASQGATTGGRPQSRAPAGRGEQVVDREPAAGSSDRHRQHHVPVRIEAGAR